ncbi:MAG: tetratricopeptide repeat protein [Aeromicrobium sp.]|nr:tetratricopeptide repeat protein [Burkholderiales bacterium]
MTARLNAARGALHAGRTEQAIGQLAQITSTEPANAEAFSLLAVGYVRIAKLGEAQQAMTRALALHPHNADYHLTAANIAQDLGHLEASVALLGRALVLRPSFAQAHNNLGIVLSDLGRVEEASNAFNEAIRLNPQYARAYANLATAQMRLLKLQDALNSAQRAINLQPEYAHAHHLLANAHTMLGDPQAAELVLTNALRLKPDLVESSLLLAQVLSKLKRPDEAERAVRHALTLSPNRAELWTLLGDLVSGRDDLAAALDAYQRSLQLRPSDVTTTARAALLLPNIYASEAHLTACRTRYTRGIDYLVANAEILSTSVTRERLGDAVSSNFLLAYQGSDDTILQRLYANFIHTLVLKALPEQANALETLRNARQGAGTSRRIRVGFCSRFFYRSTVGNYFGKWVTDLDRSVFEVFVYHSHVIEDEVVAELRGTADHFVQGAENFAFFSKRIAADELDILVYPELGMDLMCFLLAALRLAPLQVCAWGHPVTPGHPTIDYFISCAAMEPANAAAHYSERLLTLPGIGTRYDLPSVTAPISKKTRVDYQLPEDAHLYLFPQSLFKVHPANDRLLVAAMANDPEGVLVMFAGQNEGVTQKFIARLSAAFVAQGVAPQGRVKLLPFVTHDDYKRINALCDVMLDTLHWSGGNTSLDALAMGVPTVTLPGEFMRGRQTMGMLTLLGVDELIATSTDDYLAIAAKLGTNKTYRYTISQKILANVPRLFNDVAPTKALGAMLESLVVNERKASGRDASPRQ